MKAEGTRNKHTKLVLIFSVQIDTGSLTQSMLYIKHFGGQWDLISANLEVQCTLTELGKAQANHNSSDIFSSMFGPFLIIYD